MTSLNPPISFPPWIFSADPSFTSTILDATGEYVAGIFFAPITDTITKIGFRTGTITTGGDVDIRIETIAATGFPSGTLWGTNTNIVHSVSSSDDFVWIEVTLTAPASVSKGDVFCVVLRHGASLNGAFVRDNNSNYINWPQTAVNTGTPTTGGQSPVMSVYFGTNGYYPIGSASPYSDIQTRTFSNTSTPDVRGNKFVAPFDCKCSGFIIRADFDGDGTIKLYDSDGVSVLQSFSTDADYPASTSASTNRCLFSSAVSLIGGQTYYIGLEPNSSKNLSIIELISPSSAVRAQGPMGSMVAVTAKDPAGTGDWTEIPEAVYPISILINEITTGGGGSGEHYYGFAG